MQEFEIAFSIEKTMRNDYFISYVYVFFQTLYAISIASPSTVNFYPPSRIAIPTYRIA